MLLTNLGDGAALPLPLGRLPPPHFPQAVSFLAVALVPPPCLVTPTAVLAQAFPLPQTAGGGTLRWRILVPSHGRLRLPWGSPGRMLKILLGHFPVRRLILPIRPFRNPAAALVAVTDDVTHLASTTPKETEEEGLPNLRAVLAHVKEDRRKQGRRRFRYDQARKETKKETVATDPSEKADEEGYERRIPFDSPFTLRVTVLPVARAFFAPAPPFAESQSPFPSHAAGRGDCFF